MNALAIDDNKFGSIQQPSGNAMYSFMSGKQHIDISKMADMPACIIKALAKNGIIKTDGTEYVFAQESSGPKQKMVVNATTDGVLESYKLFACESSQQSQYINGSITNGAATFDVKFKGVGQSADMGDNHLTVSGNYDGTNWTSKTVSIYSKRVESGNTMYTAYTTTQAADYLIAQMSGDMLISGSPAPIKIYSKFKFGGTTPKDYVMGQGSEKHNINSAGDSTVHWNDDLSDNNMSSIYSSDVGTGTYLTIPINFNTHVFQSGETWDCNNGSATILDPTSISTDKMQAVGTDMQSCQGEFSDATSGGGNGA